MENEKNHIDKLYSDKFSNYESNISADDWTALSAKLSKVNFLKFSFTTFNAYFLFAIVMFIVTVIYFGINNFNLPKKIEKLNKKTETLQEQQIKHKINPLPVDTSNTKELEFDIPSETNQDKVIEVKPNEKTKEKNIVPEKQLEKDTTTTAMDTSLVIKPDTTLVQPKKIIRRIKKKVFIKQDKVIIKDTITVKKKE